MSATILRESDAAASAPAPAAAPSGEASPAPELAARAILAELLNRSRTLEYALSRVEAAAASGGRPAQREALNELYHTLQVFALDLARARTRAREEGILGPGGGYNRDWLTAAPAGPPDRGGNGSQTPATRAGPATELPTGIEKVLLVDPDDATREPAARLLRDLGYRVHEARSGEEVLAHLATNADEVHLLVASVALPGMNAHQLAESVTSWHPRARVLFARAGESPAPAPAGSARDAERPAYRSWWIEKPFRPSDLARKVREALEG